VNQTITLAKGERSLTRIVSVLSSLARDKAWKIEIKEVKRARSNDQNAYLWGVVYPTICKHLQGWDANDVHEYCLGEWSGWETLEGFGRRRIKPVRRSSKLTTTEFMDFVAHIQRTMSLRGIYIPDPNEVAHDNAA
jgi:hypothetical protein